MYEPERSTSASDHDTTLLEGLFQLAVAGETQGWEFDKIDSEVYSRLLQNYAG
ncbi:hypothetical protein ACSBPQ_08395 [Stenotrophomonas sp. JC08]|uniref:hypothetical protein n=1 Tax=Stenotrophomonas sp. JC08 TaxID=3445779 RepID=UPI003FA263B0